MVPTLKAALIPKTWIERFFWGFIIGLTLLLVWQAFDRAHPSTVTERTVLTPEVRPGQLLKVRIKQVQHFPAEVTIYRSLYDGFGYRFDYGVQVFPPKELEPEFIQQIPILLAASPGRSKLTTTACWERPLNIIHQIWPVCVPMKSVEFTILPAE